MCRLAAGENCSPRARTRACAVLCCAHAPHCTPQRAVWAASRGIAGRGGLGQDLPVLGQGRRVFNLLHQEHCLEQVMSTVFVHAQSLRAMCAQSCSVLACHALSVVFSPRVPCHALSVMFSPRVPCHALSVMFSPRVPCHALSVVFSPRVPCHALSVVFSPRGSRPASLRMLWLHARRWSCAGLDPRLWCSGSSACCAVAVT